MQQPQPQPCQSPGYVTVSPVFRSSFDSPRLTVRIFFLNRRRRLYPRLVSRTDLKNGPLWVNFYSNASASPIPLNLRAVSPFTRPLVPHACVTLVNCRMKPSVYNMTDWQASSKSTKPSGSAVAHKAVVHEFFPAASVHPGAFFLCLRL